MDKSLLSVKLGCSDLVHQYQHGSTWDHDCEGNQIGSWSWESRDENGDRCYIREERYVLEQVDKTEVKVGRCYL